MRIATDTDGTDLQYTIFNAVSNTTDNMVKRVDMTWATFTGDYESDLGLAELKKDAAYGACFVIITVNYSVIYQTIGILRTA